MQEDLEMLRSPEKWPNDPICVKTQPWESERRGKMNFGFYYAGTAGVVLDDGTVENFSSLEELTAVWSVD